jgi:hypothetical protein
VATLVAARQLLNNPPPPRTSPSTPEQWLHDIDQLIITTINMLFHRRQLPSAGHSRTPTVSHALIAPRAPLVAREPPAAHVPSAACAPVPPHVPAASIPMADPQAKLNYHRDREYSRITIERQLKRHCNIEGRNLGREFDSLASAQEAPAAHIACPPSSPGVSRGCMVLAPHLHMVV